MRAIGVEEGVVLDWGSIGCRIRDADGFLVLMASGALDCAPLVLLLPCYCRVSIVGINVGSWECQETQSQTLYGQHAVKAIPDS